MSRIAYAALGRPGSFARDGRYAKPQVPDEPVETEDVAVVLDAKHLCVSARGIQDETSSTVTAEYAGAFKDPQTRTEFLKYLDL